MEVGSTCQGFRSADEVQLVRLFDNLAETNAPAVTHYELYIQLDQTRCILFSWNPCSSFILFETEQTLLPCRTEAWCSTLCSQNCYHGLPGLSRDFPHHSFLVKPNNAKGCNCRIMFPPSKCFFFLYVLSTLQWGGTGHFQRKKTQIMLSTPSANLLQESVVSKDEALRSAKPSTQNSTPLFFWIFSEPLSSDQWHDGVLHVLRRS